MTQQATPPPAQPGPPPATPEAAPAAPAAPETTPAAPAKAPSKAGGMVKRIIGAVVVFAVISFGGWAWKHLTGAAETAKVGDCLAGQSEEDLRVVDCSDATAQHKVIGKVTDKSEAAFNTSAGDICSAFPTTESAFWWGERGGNGDVLCLEPMKG